MKKTILSAGAAVVILLAARHPAAAPAQGAQATDFPDGPGKTILVAACTSCHELTEVTKLRGYYTRDQWRDVVVTMVKYGAVLKDKEQDVLVDFLFVNLGKKEQP